MQFSNSLGFSGQRLQGQRARITTFTKGVHLRNLDYYVNFHFRFLCKIISQNASMSPKYLVSLNIVKKLPKSLAIVHSLHLANKNLQNAPS